jgi:hypothetical protein
VPIAKTASNKAAMETIAKQIRFFDTIAAFYQVLPTKFCPWRIKPRLQTSGFDPMPRRCQPHTFHANGAWKEYVV